jgi:mRNA interferase MazF
MGKAIMLYRRTRDVHKHTGVALFLVRSWRRSRRRRGQSRPGRRPALVISPKDFNIATGLAAVCPITNTGTGSKFEVPVPRGTRLTGYILAHQFRSVDWIARNAEFHSKANDELMWEVLGRIEAILTIECG